MRRATILIAAFFLAVALPVRAADYFQQFHHTTLRVKLDTGRKWISGTASIVYANASPDTLRDFYLHLYPNAFRNQDSAYMRDKNRQYDYVLLDLPRANRGWLDLSDMKIDGTAVDVLVDDTIAHMKLPQPLLPGDTLRLQFKFDGKVRKALDRAGYRGDHYDFAQWYPKIVVYDEAGFHTDKFEAGEFYGEFGTFDVHLELPDHFVVAGTGVVQSGDPGWDYNPPHRKSAPRREKTDRTKIVHFHAENVHDFAWCTDPSFVVQDTVVNNVEVRSVYRRSSASTWEDSTLAHAVRSLAWLERKVGKYPYPHITVCDMLRTGGMEYPMFVMDGRADEGLAVHEIGHQYFYGLLANNEREEGWFDEGFTSFQTRWFQEQRYGEYGRTERWNWYQRMTPQYGLWETPRRNIFDLYRRHYDERVSFRSEEYVHSMRLNIYDKSALVIRALRFSMGEESFDRFLPALYQRWQFKHVNEERVRTVAEEVGGRDLLRLFEQWLHTRKVVDYELARSESRASGDSVITEVEIKRRGELYCPIAVVYTMRDGTAVTRRIDSRDRTLRQRVTLPARPSRVAINPDNEIMDVNLSNNVRPRRYDLEIDWPNNAYYPEDAYQIRLRPAAWYNDVDGAKLGAHLRGSLHGWDRRIRLGVYYGAESEEVDFSAGYEEPFHMFGSNGTFRASGFKMEGRTDARLELSFVRRARLLEPPTHEFRAGYGYHELRDPVYLTSPEIYDTSQADVGPYFGYAVEPQLDIASLRFDAGVILGRDWFAGDYDYERLAATFTLHSRPEVVKVDLRWRLFGGFAGGSVPTSRKFNLAGAGPVQSDERFWLRAPGAVPDELHYLEPGDGNLRGYREGTFGCNKLVATNVELGHGIKLPGPLKVVHSVIGATSLVGFYDAGWIVDNNNPIASSARVASLVDQGVLNATLQDAGVGIRSRVAWPFWNFTWRFDVPFWVSTPEVNTEDEQLDFRFLFSLGATF